MPWHKPLDLTQIASHDPPLAMLSPGSYVFTDSDGFPSEHVLYQGFTNQLADGRVHELWSDSPGDWHHHDLSDETDAPEAGAMPFTGYQFTPRGDTAQQHVNYLGTDGNVHELFWNGDWHHNNLTENANAIANPKAPPGNTSPKGYEFGGNQHVIYQGVDLHVHELFWHEDDQWLHTDLTAHVGGPLAQGFPTAYVCDFQKTQHVIYRGFDDHIYELAGVDQWNHTDLTVAAGGAPLAATDPDAYVLSFQGTQHVNYWGHDGHLHELWWGLDQWHHADLTLTSTGHDVQHSIGAAVGFVFEPLETQFLYYSGIDGNIYELRWHVGGPWTATDVTTVPGVAAPPSISDPTGYVFPPYGSFPNVVYNSDQHHIVRLSFTP